MTAKQGMVKRMAAEHSHPAVTLFTVVEPGLSGKGLACPFTTPLT